MGVWELWGPCRAPSGSRGKAPGGKSEYQKLTTLSENILFWTVHGYTNQFNTKWKKNQFGGGKIGRQATVLAHWAQRVGGRLHALPSGLRRQWHSVQLLPPTHWNRRIVITACISPHCAVTGFPNFTFTFHWIDCIRSRVGNIFFMWTRTLSCDLDLRICPQYAPPCHMSRSKVI